MTAKGHIIFSLSSIIIAKKTGISFVLYEGDWWHIIPATLLTCLIPDIDHKKSLLGYRLTWISLPISRIFGHRKFTHSLLSIIFVASFICFLSKKMYFPKDIRQAMLIGYISHIIADMFTLSGVPLFWPYYYRYRFPIICFRTGEKKEKYICISLLFFSILYPKWININLYFNIVDYISYYIKNFNIFL